MLCQELCFFVDIGKEMITMVCIGLLLNETEICITVCAIFFELLCNLNKTFNNLILSFMEGNRYRLDLSAPTLTSTL